jgi:hypothetical protein
MTSSGVSGRARRTRAVTSSPTPGPFCLYHVAAAHGMARRASSPDEKTRSLFEQVWDSLDDEDQQVPQ